MKIDLKTKIGCNGICLMIDLGKQFYNTNINKFFNKVKIGRYIFN